ncbi:MAG: FKBP-type peptidyl-prolyl cis-trans isomerase [Fibrobacteraceae bacterium]|nr:FKBP-type peptidyl-prolyl cis-trans isomerase [Fibrobacteraceae bacterium]
MKAQLYLYAIALGGMVAACGGEKPKPVVNPEPAPAPASVAKAPLTADSLKTSQDRYSYALGMDLGKAIANVNVPIKLDYLLQAIKDQVDTSAKVLLSDSASEAALQDMLLQMQKQKELDAANAAKKALEDQKAFLETNKKDSTVKVTAKGVQYKVVKEGTGLVPKANDKVQVHYIGALLDGTEFDNSVKRGEPLEFPVTAVIEGWQDLLMNMKEGMKVKAWIPSQLAYGEQGVPPMIPGNSMLVFEVELIKVFAETPAAEAPADSSIQSNAAPAAESATEPAKADSSEAEPAKAEPAKPEADKTEAKKADVKKAAKPAKKK